MTLLRVHTSAKAVDIAKFRVHSGLERPLKMLEFCFKYSRPETVLEST